MGAGERGFAERDRQAARNFAQAAKRAGVSRIVYLGGLGDDSADLSHHLASRHETGAQLAAHGVPVTEFRAAVIIGSGSASFEILRHLTERLPIMITPRWVGTRCQPIGIADVLDYLVGALDHPEVTGRRRGRRPRHPLVRRHDAGVRSPPRPPSADDPGPGAHAPALVVLGEPDLPGAGRHRPAAHRGPSQRGRRPGSRPGRRVRPPPAFLRRGARAGDRSSRPPRRRVHLVRRARRVGSGEPLVGHLPRGDDRRASGAGRRRAAGAGLRRGGASRRRCGLAVCERPLEDQGTRGSPGRRRRDAPRTPRPRPSPGRRRARLLAGGGAPPAEPAPPAGGDEGARPGVAPIRGDRSGGQSIGSTATTSSPPGSMHAPGRIG